MENTKENDVQITINKPTRVLHFSDGVEEEMEQEEVFETKAEPANKETVDPKTLSWGPWFAHCASKSSQAMINAVDYAGESLANFFGITTPKYQLEISEFERLEEEKKKIEEETAGWMPKSGGGDVPLVLNEPGKDLNNV